MKTNKGTKANYSFLAKLLHWSFIFLFAYGIFKQVDNINQLEDIYLLKFEMLFALFFLSFLVFRFFYMTKTQEMIRRRHSKVSTVSGQNSTFLNVYLPCCDSMLRHDDGIPFLVRLKGWAIN